MSAAVVCMSMLSSCDSENQSSIAETSTPDSTVDGIEPVVEQEYEYAFPEFLTNKDAISLFSNLVYSSFDARNVTAAITEQPFENVQCEMSFLDGTYYSYLSDNKRGLLDAEGNIVVVAAYTEIVMIRPDAFMLVNELGEEKLAFVGENGIINTKENGKNNWFTSAEPLKIVQATNNEDNTVTYFLQAANGKVVYDKYWDYLEPTVLDTPASATYSAYLGDAYYFIVFDKYYNYKIYEGSYATVEVFVDGQYGSCFVLSIGDFNEISSMIDSFGSFSGAKASPQQQNTDYVKFSFANSSSKKKTVTISEDGFVYTEAIDPEDGTSYKYFTLVDKICFTDVIDWINGELSKEYVKTK